jgi:hypothetical protein
MPLSCSLRASLRRANGKVALDRWAGRPGAQLELEFAHARSHTL